MWNFFVSFRRFLSTSPTQVLHILGLVGGENKGRLDVQIIFTLYTLYLKDSLSINIAYNNDPAGYFEIVDNSMVEYPANIIEGEYSYIGYNFEILEKFFKNKNINWINCNSTWGWYDDESERWTGAVGKVKKQAENGLQSRSSENCRTAVWHYA